MTQDFDQPARCTWVAATRCRYPGALSNGTHGSGPWLCLGHFHCSDPSLGAAIVAQSERDHPQGAPDTAAIVAASRARYLAGATSARSMGRGEARDALRAIGKPTNDPKAWARRILERHGSGEILPMLSIELAREALGGTITNREPGQEG